MQKDGKTSNNARTALLLGGLVAGMVGLSFAAVPLYDLFCRVTGFGGTTQVATELPEQISEQTIKVRFNADVNKKLPWAFQPTEREVSLRLGESGLTFYKARNLAARRTVGTATYNVSPPSAGKYFSKVQCFCFTEQALEPGQEMEMAVSYFVDPAILEDPETRNLKTITLSYTFFRDLDDWDAEQELQTGQLSLNGSAEHQ